MSQERLYRLSRTVPFGFDGRKRDSVLVPPALENLDQSLLVIGGIAPQNCLQVFAEDGEHDVSRAVLVQLCAGVFERLQKAMLLSFERLPDRRQLLLERS